MRSDVVDWSREPGRGKYARPERERRFVVLGDPPVIGSRRSIEDRYLEGLRLRLRHVQGDGESVYKLTQKVRVHQTDPADLAITNIYLSQAEHARLSELPAAVLRKTRVVCRTEAMTFVLDEFEGHLHGLRLAEVEVDDLEAALSLPLWLGREVTHDDRFSGGYLAGADPQQVSELLAVCRAASDAGD